MIIRKELVKSIEDIEYEMELLNDDKDFDRMAVELPLRIFGELISTPKLKIRDPYRPIYPSPLEIEYSEWAFFNFSLVIMAL